MRVPRVKTYSEELDRALFYEMLPDDPEGEDSVAHPERILFQRMLEMPVEVGVVSSTAPHRWLFVNDEPCLHNGDLSRSGHLVTMRVARDVFLKLSHPDDFKGGFHRLRAGFVKQLNFEALNKAKRFVAGPARAPICELMSAQSRGQEPD